MELDFSLKPESKSYSALLSIDKVLRYSIPSYPPSFDVVCATVSTVGAAGGIGAPQPLPDLQISDLNDSFCENVSFFFSKIEKERNTLAAKV